MAELNARIIAKASATTGEVPLAADLQVAEIAVNTADGKLFTKHTDDSIKEISGSGGGAAIEDAVSSESGYISWVLAGGSAANPSAGECGRYDPYPNSIFVSTTTIEGDFKSLLYAITPYTSNATVFRDGFQVYYGQITAAANKNNDRMNLDFDPSQWITSLEPGDIISMYYEGWPARTNPSDGQIARYSAANAEWYASPALSVQSVNGFSEANVSLQVKDLSDVGDRYSAGLVTSWQTASDPTPSAGVSSPFSGYNTSFFMSTIDINGVDYEDSLYATNPNSTIFDISINGVVVYSGVCQTSNKGSLSRMDLGWPSYVADFEDVVQAGDAIGVFWANYDGNNPAQEGDSLTYTKGRWRPVAGGDYVSMTTLKAETAASTDFADFQSRIAAL